MTRNFTKVYLYLVIASGIFSGVSYAKNDCVEFNNTLMNDNTSNTHNYEKDVELANSIENTNLYQHALEYSAKTGNAEAQYRFGDMLYNGDGVQRNLDKAIYWYKLAANNGHNIAQYNLGKIYESGKNDADAANWYSIAANNGNIDAKFNIATMYETGRGIKKNISEAIKWYKDAAKSGHVYSQFRLGNIYDKGILAEQNYDEATYWYKLASSNGFFIAKNCLADMYLHGRGIKKNPKKAIELLLETVSISAEANFKLGYMYENGIGVDKNSEEAIKWYKSAIEKGHDEATERLYAIKTSNSKIEPINTNCNANTQLNNGCGDNPFEVADTSKTQPIVTVKNADDIRENKNIRKESSKVKPINNIAPSANAKKNILPNKPLSQSKKRNNENLKNVENTVNTAIVAPSMKNNRIKSVEQFSKRIGKNIAKQFAFFENLSKI